MSLFCKSAKKEQRLQILMEILDNYDFVCIQELFTIGLLGFRLTGLKTWLVNEAKVKKAFYFGPFKQCKFWLRFQDF